MTTPDRTEDLLRVMLERRAGAPAPGWLLPGVAEAVRKTGQARGGHAWSGLAGTRRFGRLAFVAAAALVLLALAAGVLVAARLILPPPQPTLPAIVVVPSPSATVPPATPEPTSEPTDRPPTPTPAPPAFAPDTIAIVTTAGDDLRVRSTPGVGADSKKLTPLLKKGSRMLIVDGPVTADTYDWYEVQADNGLFGWVAAGKGSEDWIEPTEPKCADDLDESTLWTVDPIDFLVCYGNTPVSARVLWTEPAECCDTGTPTVEVPRCQYTGGNRACVARPRWLVEPWGFTLVAGEGGPHVVDAAVPKAMADRLNEMPPVVAATLELSMDTPQAQDCRVVDRQGRDLVTRDEAITRCRLTFAVRDVAWDPADARLEPYSLARVVVPILPLQKGPERRQVGQPLVAGEEVLVVGGPYPYESGVTWYEILPSDPMGHAFGTVPFTTADGTRTLEATKLDCPPPANWSAVAELLPLERLACFGSGKISQNLTVTRQQPPEPDWGACDLYRATTVNPQSCVATPELLATFSGIVSTDAQGRGMGVELRFDPRFSHPEMIPETATVMRVTGSFGSAASGACRVFNPATDKLLLEEDAADAYCRTQFVVTKVEPVP